SPPQSTAHDRASLSFAVNAVSLGGVRRDDLDIPEAAQRDQRVEVHVRPETVHRAIGIGEVNDVRVHTAKLSITAGPLVGAVGDLYRAGAQTDVREVVSGHPA